MLCLGFLAVQSESVLWVVYPLLAVMACFSAAFEPASAAALPNLVDGGRPRDGERAVAGRCGERCWWWAPRVGGVVTAILGRDTAIVVDAVSFVGSALLLVRIRRSFQEDARRGEARSRWVEAARETIHYARRDHRVLALLAVKFGWGLAGGVLVLVPLLADGRFDAGEIGIGLLLAARGFGALVGPFVGRASLGEKDRRLFLTIGVALAVFGAGYALLGIVPSLLLALPAVALAHTGGGAQWMLSSYGLQKIVPDHIRGRIFAFDGDAGDAHVRHVQRADRLARGGLRPQLTAVIMGGIAVRVGRRVDVAHDRRPARHDVGGLRRTARRRRYEAPGARRSPTER